MEDEVATVDRAVQTGIGDEDGLVQITSSLKQVQLGIRLDLLNICCPLHTYTYYSCCRELLHISSTSAFSWILVIKWNFATIRVVSNEMCNIYAAAAAPMLWCFQV